MTREEQVEQDSNHPLRPFKKDCFARGDRNNKEPATSNMDLKRVKYGESMTLQGSPEESQHQPGSNAATTAFSAGPSKGAKMTATRDKQARAGVPQRSQK